jgi:hypothetical protein
LFRKNAGMIASRIKDLKQFELYGRLHTDISFQNRYIINNVDMVLRLIRNKSSFCLMGDGVHNYELLIDEATLYMRQVKISPAVMLQHAMALQHAKATAAQGSYLNNPLNFKNFDLSQISVTDYHHVPNSPLNLNLKENSYIRA